MRYRNRRVRRGAYSYRELRPLLQLSYREFRNTSMQLKIETKREKTTDKPTSGVRVQPTRESVFSRILADARLSAKSYVDRWVVNRGAE